MKESNELYEIKKTLNELDKQHFTLMMKVAMIDHCYGDNEKKSKNCLEYSTINKYFELQNKQKSTEHDNSKIKFIENKGSQGGENHTFPSTCSYGLFCKPGFPTFNSKNMQDRSENKRENLVKDKFFNTKKLFQEFSRDLLTILLDDSENIIQALAELTFTHFIYNPSIHPEIKEKSDEIYADYVENNSDVIYFRSFINYISKADNVDKHSKVLIKRVDAILTPLSIDSQYYNFTKGV